MKFKFKFGIQIWSWHKEIDVGTEPPYKLLGFSITDALFSVLTLNCPITLTIQVGW